MTNVWYHLFECDALHRSEIIENLSQSDLDIYELDPNAPWGMGILFFDEFSPRLCDFLHEISHNGLKRVLAIAVSPNALENSNPWRLLQSGASDVFALDHPINTVEKIVTRFNRWTAVDQLIESPLVRDTLVGQGPAWKSVLRQIVEVARFTDSSVLITGESGTGKELVARLIHTLDPRTGKRDLVVLDCTTIVPELSGSEFFGHERGAFTGAITARDGAFALANGGTLFLDEVGELPLKLQAQLLRVVQERTFKRVGGNAWHSTDFRLMCATNKDLMQQVKQGEFRSDLYYRIANWTCTLPPLRERNEDILLLAQHFMKQLRPDEDQPALDKSVSEYFLRREYPGNVRDLKQLVSQIMYRYVGHGLITVGDIPEEERPLGEFEPVNWCDGHFEKAIRKALLLDVGLREIRRVAENTAIRIAVT